MNWGQGSTLAAALAAAVPSLAWQEAHAQDAAAALSAQTPSAPAAASPPAQQVPLDACASALAEKRQGNCIPALTPVQVELSEPLSSRTSITGQAFAFSLVAPISVGGVEMIAAGTKGQGEVVHAKKTGVGVGGELVLAARYLQVGDRRLRLRSMHLNGTGRDQQGLAFAVGVAVGFPALFVRGKHIDVPVGAFADVKTAEAFWIDSATAPASSAESAAEAKKITTKEGVPDVP